MNQKSIYQRIVQEGERGHHGESGHQQAAGNIFNFSWGLPAAIFVIVTIVVIIILLKVLIYPMYAMPRPTDQYLEGGYPGTVDSVARDSLSDFLKQEVVENSSLQFNYFLVSGPDFLDSIFGRRDSIAILRRAQDEAKETHSVIKEENFISQLVQTNRPMILESESFRFSRYVWQNFIRNRQYCVWKINLPFAALLSRPTKDRRFRLSSSNKVVWFDADNRTLLQNGWLGLDPLLQNIANANINYHIPFAKAGFTEWTESSNDPSCDNIDPNAPQEPVVVKHFEKSFIVPRKIKFLFLDIENISKRTLEKVTLETRDWIPEQSEKWNVCDEACRTKKLNEQASNTTIIPHGTLKRGEHFVIPLGVLLAEYDDDSDYKPKSDLPIVFFGPMQRIEHVTFLKRGSTESIAVRSFDPAKLVLISNHFGFEGGSCPYVYSIFDKTGEWMVEQQVLVGANALSKFRTDRLPLKRFTGQLLLTEEEAETSFIDYVAVEAMDEKGNKKILSVADGILQRVDNESIRLNMGETKLLRFADWHSGLTTPTLIISGYYLPKHTAAPSEGQGYQQRKRPVLPLGLQWQGVHASQ